MDFSYTIVEIRRHRKWTGGYSEWAVLEPYFGIEFGRFASFSSAAIFVAASHYALLDWGQTGSLKPGEVA